MDLGYRSTMWARWAFAISASVSALSSAAYAAGGAITRIDADTLRGSAGITAVNMAAGDQIIQLNALAMAVSEGGRAQAVIEVEQRIEASETGGAVLSTRTEIGAGAFAHTQGVLAINQASGQGNLQANTFAIALGIDGEALADSALSQSLPDASPPSGDPERPEGLRSASVEDGAFAGSQGVVQVNQAAGSWNTTANSFGLRMVVDIGP